MFSHYKEHGMNSSVPILSETNIDPDTITEQCKIGKSIPYEEECMDFFKFMDIVVNTLRSNAGAKDKYKFKITVYQKVATKFDHHYIIKNKDDGTHEVIKQSDLPNKYTLRTAVGKKTPMD